jgi:hypothetical protein
VPLEPREVLIGERRFTLSPLPAMRAHRLLARLGRIAGPAVISAIIEGGLSAQALPALASFFDKLSPDELEGLTRELLAGSSVNDGKSNQDVMAVFDIAFQGRLHEVLQLLREALVLNYGASFHTLLGAGSGLLQKASA